MNTPRQHCPTCGKKNPLPMAYEFPSRQPADVDPLAGDFQRCDRCKSAFCTPDGKKMYRIAIERQGDILVVDGKRYLSIGTFLTRYKEQGVGLFTSTR